MARRPPAHLDLGELLRTLVRHKVRFIVIGGIAGALHGSATPTRDLDLVYDRDRSNIRRLAAALVELDARRRDLPAGLPGEIDERAILNGTNFHLITKFGEIDCLGETPAERLTYATLAVDAVRFDVGDVTVTVTSLDDLIRMKRATGRERDRIEVERLDALRDEHELHEPEGPYARPRKGRKPRQARARGSRRGTERPGRHAASPRSPRPARSSPSPTARARRSGRGS